ncbi:MAG: hypothetical protein JXR20_02830 [Balneola sp.]
MNSQKIYKTNSDTHEILNRVLTNYDKLGSENLKVSKDFLIRFAFTNNEITKKPLLLNLKYRIESRFKPQLINEKKEIFDRTVDYLQSALEPLRVSEDSLSITSSGTLYIKFLLDGVYFVRFEVFIDESDKFDLDRLEVAINIEEEGKQIFGTVCSLREIVNHLFDQTENLRITKTYPDYNYFDEEVVPTFDLDTSS